MRRIFVSVADQDTAMRIITEMQRVMKQGGFKIKVWKRSGIPNLAPRLMLKQKRYWVLFGNFPEMFSYMK